MQAQGKWVVPAVDDIAHEHDVAGGLCHLAPVCQQVLAVHPASYDVVPHGRFRLRALVLVMRKAQVDPTGVHVEVLAEVVQ